MISASESAYAIIIILIVLFLVFLEILSRLGLLDSVIGGDKPKKKIREDL